MRGLSACFRLSGPIKGGNNDSSEFSGTTTAYSQVSARFSKALCLSKAWVTDSISVSTGIKSMGYEHFAVALYLTKKITISGDVLLSWSPPPCPMELLAKGCPESGGQKPRPIRFRLLVRICISRICYILYLLYMLSEKKRLHILDVAKFPKFEILS